MSLLCTIAKDYSENIKFVKINVDQEPDLASKYGIQGIPVIKFFCEGKEVGEIVGYLPQNALTKEIENISKNAPNSKEIITPIFILRGM